MDIPTTIQIIFIFVIFILCLSFVLLPLKIISQDPAKHNNRVLSFCNCFSGGVFLGTCFLQLVPFIEDKFNEIFYQLGIPLSHTSSVTQVTVTLGFFLVLFIEQTVRVCQGNGNLGDSSKKSLGEPRIDYEDYEDDSEVEIYSEEHRMLSKRTANSSQNNTNSQHFMNGNGSDSETEVIALGTVGDNTINSKTTTDFKDKWKTKVTDNHSHHSHSHHGHSHISDIVKGDFGLRCMLLLFALSIHSLFEGLALGLQGTTYKVVTLFAGVAIHEVLVAFAIGTNLAQQNLKIATVVKLSLIFSSTIPTGMVLGLCLKGLTSTAGQILSATIQGLTAGTFVYVTFLEILPSEINGQDNCLWKVLFMFLGFGVIGCLKFGISEEGEELEPYYQPLRNITG